jgi:hypothetical protein
MAYPSLLTPPSPLYYPALRPSHAKRTRHVGDFTRWKDHDSYRKAFDRLLRDLKAEI